MTVRQTSRDAFDQAPEGRDGLVFQAIKDSRDGLTDWELHQVLEIPYSGVQRPRGNLVEARLIVDSNRRRRTGYGRMAIVWVASSPTAVHQTALDTPRELQQKAALFPEWDE